MNDDLHRIATYVSGLIARERLLLLARVVLQLGLVAGALVVFMALAPVLGLERSTSVALLVLGAGFGSWAAGLLPLLLRWQRSGDRLRQARRVEALLPELRGRLVTSVQRLDRASAQESSALVSLAATRALGTVGKLPGSRVHSALPLLPIGAANGVVGVVALLALVLSPLGLSGLGAWWRGDLPDVSLLSDALPGTSPEAAKVGDILIRYTFPPYTGLEPLEVPNSTGDVQGPPGTRVGVKLKSQRPVSTGALLAYDEPAREVEIGAEGRTISGTFAITANPGQWRLRTVAAGATSETRSFEITPQPDLPPEVNIDAPARLEVGEEQRFQIPWVASDDYGVSSVRVHLDGTPRGLALFESTERRPAADGTLAVSPRELGLSEGTVVRLNIVATDNNTVSGAKSGASRPVELVVLGESGLDASLDKRVAEMKSVLLTVLADFLEEPWPVGDTSNDVARWGEKVSQRFEAFDELASSYSRAWRVNRIEREAILLVQTRASKLVRYTQVAFTPGSTERPAPAAWQEVTELRNSSVVALEDAILNLDAFQEAVAMKQVREAVERLERQGQRLAELMAEDAPQPQAMLAELDVLERRLSGLKDQLGKLDQDGLAEMLNQRADGLESIAEQIRSALAEGSVEEAQELMKRLQAEIERLSQHLKDQANRAQQQANESMEKAASLLEELKELEQAQAALQEQTQAIRDREDAAAAKEAARLWKQLDSEVEALLTEGGAYRAGLEAGQRAFYEQERAAQSNEDVRRLQESVVARDLRGAQREAFDARRSWERTESTLLRERSLRRSLSGPGLQEMRAIQGRISTIDRLLSELDQLDERSSPQARRQARELEQEQKELEQRVQQASEQAKALSREFPVRPDGLEEALDDAEQQAGQAANELGEGKPMPAEGAQEVATQRLQDAQRALQEAMRQAAAQQRAGQEGGENDGEGEPGGPGGDEARGGGEGDGDFDQGRFEMPPPEDDFSAEEYRRSLLQGMEGDVPEEYRALKKRYYEELVRQ